MRQSLLLKLAYGRLASRGCAQSAFAVCLALVAAFSAMAVFHRVNASSDEAFSPISPGVSLSLALDDRALCANPALSAIGRDRHQLSAMAAFMLKGPQPVVQAAPLLEPIGQSRALRLAMVAPPVIQLKPLAALTAGSARARAFDGSRSPSRGFSGLMGGASSAMKTPLAAFEISSRYGWRGRHFHNGVDLTAPIGSPVMAAAAGRVISAGMESQYGNLVEILHANGLKTRYAHLKAMTVRPGQIVAQGQRIGWVGMTGRSTGPHLHFEVTLAGNSQNPERFLWR